jgi:hypothetical protein
MSSLGDKMINKEERLRFLLGRMIVPEFRKTILDLGWLNRNLFVKNRDHPDFAEAMEIIKSLALHR